MRFERSPQANANAALIIKSQKRKNATYVIMSQQGKQIYPDKICVALKKALEEFGLKGGVHRLRDTFTDRLRNFESGMNSTKEILGDANLQTIQIYPHPRIDGMRVAVGRLA